MILILDEWIIHDLQGDNGQNRQKESYKFLETIINKCDKIAILRGSKFIEKIFHFAKKACNLGKRELSKMLVNKFLFNLKKSEIINFENIESEEIKNILEEVKPDDHYIVQLYYYLNSVSLECLIITTDKPLLEIFKKYNIKSSYRDEFLEYYTKEF